ncbi:19493_t:CDS:2 [Funneliformis geosporum]|uniref:14624_t:CDS:1 n=1 Tax=Funneliformis geosporum TaxID=1117311 RepID=A0A9W4T6A9_9GLOM|nr:19493_t:CDS:2 [Funneliformis geosporum]CAI2194556.1 14624_t:CDS:2 [Funneliformis geosporum]
MSKEFGAPNKRSSSCLSSSSIIVKMWVLLEGSPRARKLNADISKAYDLDDFVYILQEEYEELRDVRPQNIVILNNNNTQLQPDTDLQTLTKTTTAKNSLVVRYPLSNANIKGTFVYGQRQTKREIPHTSGSFSLLKALAREIFTELEREEIYFVNNGMDIWDVHNFNTVIFQTTQDNDNNVTLKLIIKIKGRKKYSDWNIKDVFKDILGRPDYESLGDMPRFNLDELPPLKHPFSQEEGNKFFGELKCHLNNIQKEIENESSARFEKELKGSRGYGTIDYAVKMIEVFLVLCEEKLEDMKQRMAQNIVQVHSAMERLSNSGQAEPKMYGIVTTGKLWRFVRWTGSLDEPVVHISEEYTCNLTGNLENEKEMVKYIAQIIQAQVTAFCDHDNENNLHLSKRLCTGQRNDK